MPAGFLKENLVAYSIPSLQNSSVQNVMAETKTVLSKINCCLEIHISSCVLSVFVVKIFFAVVSYFRFSYCISKSNCEWVIRLIT